MQAHVEDIKKTHLRNLLGDTERCKSMMVYVSLSLFFYKLFFHNNFWQLLKNVCNLSCVVHSEFDGIMVDYSRQQATVDTVDKLYNLAEVKFASFRVGYKDMYNMIYLLIPFFC